MPSGVGWEFSLLRPFGVAQRADLVGPWLPPEPTDATMKG